MTWFRRPAGDEEPGRINLGYNALDRHVVAGRAAEPALYHPEGRDLDFAGLLAEVSALGGAFIALGVQAGAAVVLALADPTDELVAVLACARLGAVAHLAAEDDLAAVTDQIAPVLVATSAAPEATEHLPGARLLRGVEPVDPTRDLDWEVAMRAGRTQGSAVADRAPDDVAYRVDGREVTLLEAARGTDRIGGSLRELVAGRPVRLSGSRDPQVRG